MKVVTSGEDGHTVASSLAMSAVMLITARLVRRRTWMNI